MGEALIAQALMAEGSMAEQGLKDTQSERMEPEPCVFYYGHAQTPPWTLCPREALSQLQARRKQALPLWQRPECFRISPDRSLLQTAHRDAATREGRARYVALYQHTRQHIIEWNSNPVLQEDATAAATATAAAAAAVVTAEPAGDVSEVAPYDETPPPPHHEGTGVAGSSPALCPPAPSPSSLPSFGAAESVEALRRKLMVAFRECLSSTSRVLRPDYDWDAEDAGEMSYIRALSLHLHRANSCLPPDLLLRLAAGGRAASPGHDARPGSSPDSSTITTDTTTVTTTDTTTDTTADAATVTDTATDTTTEAGEDGAGQKDEDGSDAVSELHIQALRVLIATACFPGHVCGLPAEDAARLVEGLVLRYRIARDCSGGYSLPRRLMGVAMTRRLRSRNQQRQQQQQQQEEQEQEAGAGVEAAAGGAAACGTRAAAGFGGAVKEEPHVMPYPHTHGLFNVISSSSVEPIQDPSRGCAPPPAVYGAPTPGGGGAEDGSSPRSSDGSSSDLAEVETGPPGASGEGSSSSSSSDGRSGSSQGGKGGCDHVFLGGGVEKGRAADGSPAQTEMSADSGGGGGGDDGVGADDRALCPVLASDHEAMALEKVWVGFVCASTWAEFKSTMETDNSKSTAEPTAATTTVHGSANGKSPTSGLTLRDQRIALRMAARAYTTAVRVVRFLAVLDSSAGRGDAGWGGMRGSRGEVPVFVAGVLRRDVGPAGRSADSVSGVAWQPAAVGVTISEELLRFGELCLALQAAQNHLTTGPVVLLDLASYAAEAWHREWMLAGPVHNRPAPPAAEQHRRWLVSALPRALLCTAAELTVPAEAMLDVEEKVALSKAQGSGTPAERALAAVRARGQVQGVTAGTLEAAAGGQTQPLQVLPLPPPQLLGAYPAAAPYLMLVRQRRVLRDRQGRPRVSDKLPAACLVDTADPRATAAVLHLVAWRTASELDFGKVADRVTVGALPSVQRPDGTPGEEGDAFRGAAGLHPPHLLLNLHSRAPVMARAAKTNPLTLRSGDCFEKVYDAVTAQLRLKAQQRAPVVLELFGCESLHTALAALALAHQRAHPPATSSPSPPPHTPPTQPSPTPPPSPPPPTTTTTLPSSSPSLPSSPSVSLPPSSCRLELQLALPERALKEATTTSKHPATRALVGAMREAVRCAPRAFSTGSPGRRALEEVLVRWQAAAEWEQLPLRLAAAWV